MVIAEVEQERNVDSKKVQDASLGNDKSFEVKATQTIRHCIHNTQALIISKSAFR